jgi:hypothetical protein
VIGVTLGHRERRAIVVIRVIAEIRDRRETKVDSNRLY